MNIINQFYLYEKNYGNAVALVNTIYEFALLFASTTIIFICCIIFVYVDGNPEVNCVLPEPDNATVLLLIEIFILVLVVLTTHHGFVALMRLKTNVNVKTLPDAVGKLVRDMVLIAADVVA